MANNTSLNKAKDTKKDEFYTRRVDIENELAHYADHFKDKVVYCNCDDPEWSEFWQFFRRNFRPWGLKKLIATHYEPDEKNYAYKLEIWEDTNGDGVVDWKDEPTITQIPCNGDFRSASCIDLLKEADIVVTNPPFSVIREYIAQLMEYEKKFLIIAPLNAVKYRDTFALCMHNKIWMGYSHPKVFRVPEGTTGKSVYVEGGVWYQKFGNVCWLTNLDIKKRHEFLDLRGTYYQPDIYQKFANFDAVIINKISDIPCDYDGIMGVPISFFDKYNPDQFILYGRTGDIDWAESDECNFFTPPTIDEQNVFKKQNRTWRVQNGYYVTDDGIAHTVYDRLFVKLKNPEPRRFPDGD